MQNQNAALAPDELESISFGIIASSGQARSLAFDALKHARAHDFEKARALMGESKKMAVQAHQFQTELLTKEASGDHVELNVLLVHAQDHLMTSMLAEELIEEIIYLHEEKADKIVEAS